MWDFLYLIITNNLLVPWILWNSFPNLKLKGSSPSLLLLVFWDTRDNSGEKRRGAESSCTLENSMATKTFPSREKTCHWKNYPPYFLALKLQKLSLASLSLSTSSSLSFLLSLYILFFFFNSFKDFIYLKERENEQG